MTSQNVCFVSHFTRIDRTARFSAALCLCLGLVVGSPATVGAVDFETIRQTWIDRETQADPITLVWEESRTQMDLDPLGDAKMQSEVAPRVTLWLSGSKARLDSPAVKPPQNEKPTEVASAFNGKEARQLYTFGHPHGTIYPEERPRFSSNVNIWPLLLLYRGTSSELCNCTLSAFEFEGDKEPTANAEIVLRSNGKGRLDSASWELSLRADLDYSPVKLVASRDDKPCIEIRLDVKRSDAGLIVPESWSASIITEKDVLVSAVTSRLLSWNQDQIPAELFDLPFPDGTIVDDLRPTASGADARMYIINGTEEARDTSLRAPSRYYLRCVASNKDWGRRRPNSRYCYSVEGRHSLD